jgi:hypothetical protein
MSHSQAEAIQVPTLKFSATICMSDQLIEQLDALVFQIQRDRLLAALRY